MKTYLQLAYFCVLILFVLQAKGQFNYKPGKVISQNGDTLTGYINDGGVLRNRKYCQYKADANGESKKYFPGDIKGYIITGERYYSSQMLKMIDSVKPVFANVLLEGKFSLYHYGKDNDLMFFIKTDSGKMVNLWNLSIELKHTTEGASSYWRRENRVTLQFYKDTLKRLFMNTPLLFDQISSLEYKQKAMQKLVKTYIGLTCTGDKCLTYEHDYTFNDRRFGITGGVQYSTITFLSNEFHGELKSDYTISYPIGLYYNSPVHIISDKLSLQAELLFYRLKYNPQFKIISNDLAYTNIENNIVTMPIMFKYSFTHRKVSPTIGVGKEIGYGFNSKFQYLNKRDASVYAGTNYQIHWQQKGGWFCDLGLNYKLSTKYNLFASLRFQRQYNLIISEEQSNHMTFHLAENDNYGKKYMTDALSLHVGIGF